MVQRKTYRGESWLIKVGRWEQNAPESVDTVIGDPGFDIATHEGHAVPSRTDSGFAGGEKSRAAVQFETVDPAEIVPPLLAISERWVVLFCAFEQLGDYRRAAGGTRKAGGEYVRGGAWIKTNPAPQISGDRPAQFGEGIAIMHPKGGKMRWNCGGKAGVWIGPTAAGEERLHVTPKPLWLMLALVEAFSDKGDTVLDPYCGSASTGVACMRLGRRFIGCEMDSDMAELASERLDAEQRGLTLQAARDSEEGLPGQISILERL